MPTVTIQHTQYDYKIAFCRIDNGVFNRFYDDPPSNIDVGTTVINDNIQRIEEAFIRFDILRDIPKNCFIKSAKLKLFVSIVINPHIDGLHKITLHELTEDFPNNYVNNEDSYPSYNSQIVDELEFAQSSWMEFDVTQSVQKIVSGQLDNFGFTLKPNPRTFPPGTDYKYLFVTSARGEVGVLTKDMFPKIEITYVDALMTPINLDPYNHIKLRKDQPIICKWGFNGYDLSNNQKSIELQYKVNSGSWVTIYQTQSNQFYTFDANTFTASNITWRLRTTDNTDTTSFFSNEETFTVVNPPSTPIITNSITVTNAKPIITWTSTNQKGYEVLIKDTENNVVWQNIDENSTAKSKAIDVILDNGETYSIELKILDNNGFWSDTDTKNITISVDSPAKPSMVLKTIDKDEGKTIFIINTSDLLFYEIFRKAENEDNFIRIATNQTESNFVDYTQASNIKYTYYVRAYNANYGFADSDPITAIINLDCSKINLVSNPEKYVNLEVRNVKQSNKNIDVSYNQYSGRKNNIPEFGEFEDESLSFEFETFNKSEFETVQDLINKKETLLYRDEQGKKIFGTIDSIQIDEDKNMDYWVYSFDFKKSDYNEEVR